MKKMMILLIVVVLFSSCDLTFSGNSRVPLVDYITDIQYSTRFHRVRLSDKEYPKFTSFNQIAYYIGRHVKYYGDGDVDFWQNADETMAKGLGDCEDFSILFMEIAYKSMGVKLNLLLVNSKQYFSREVVNGGVIDHAVIEIDGMVYEPQRGTFYPNAKIKYRYTFDEVFNL